MDLTMSGQLRRAYDLAYSDRAFVISDTTGTDEQAWELWAEFNAIWRPLGFAGDPAGDRPPLPMGGQHG